MGSEVKSIVVAGAPAANTGGSLTLLNIPLKGTTESARVGNRITIKRLTLRGFCAATPSTGVDQIHRLLLVKDNATEGSTPALLDVLSAATVYSFPNSDNVWRFQILWDRTFDLNASAEAGTIRSFSVSLPLNYLEFFNSGSAGTVADIQAGALWFIVVGTSTAGATAGSVSFNTLVEYEDA